MRVCRVGVDHSRHNRRIRKFQGVSSITLFIEDSFNGDETRIYYIGLKGESKKVRLALIAGSALKLSVTEHSLACNAVAPWSGRGSLREPTPSSRPQSG
jgi:hypothetical protein